ELHSPQKSPVVTHVAPMNDKTEKSRQAVREGKFLVHPRWIEAANYLWRKPPEENFPSIKLERNCAIYPLIDSSHSHLNERWFGFSVGSSFSAEAS
ncbi:hypothetical protein HAX54_051777, partial [Datura stramonium]|nr:hypothetical protein [Datura stramonium]